jgi:hypothetical protein
MWTKTKDDEYINLDNCVEINKRYIREHGYMLIYAVAVTGKEYFLKTIDNTGDEDEMIKQSDGYIAGLLAMHLVLKNRSVS